MLEAKELRLGNIICRRGDKKEPIVVTIDLLRGVNRQGVFFEPVALTEEWLVKFGFELNDISYHLTIGDYVIKIFFYDCWRLEISGKFEDASLQGFWNVHEFQNLIFALTNEELKSPLNE